MTTWLDVCRAYAQDTGVEVGFVEALHAFADPHPRGGPPPPAELEHSGDFDALAGDVAAHFSVADVVEDLAHEVDAGQAAVFGRRLAAVDAILERFGDATGRLLQVGLRVRLRGIMDARRPRALRVRALADFYYSYAGRHHHQRNHHDRPSWTTTLPSLRWTPVVPGLERARVAGVFAEGPVHVNLLRLQPGRVRLEALDCRAPRHAAQPFPDVVADVGATAAVSGGFFLYSETDIQPPERRYDAVDLLMTPGKVLNPPVFGRGAVAATEDGAWHIERIGPGGMHMQIGEHIVPLAGIHHRATTSDGPDTRSIAVAGRTVADVGRNLRVPIGGFVMPIPDELSAQPGDDVRYGPPLLHDGRPIRTAVAGGPLLVDDGAPAIDLRAENFWGGAPPLTFSQDETGDKNLLPRLGAGLDEDGRLVFAAVDGRNFDEALGMTLSDLQRLFLGLHCRVATNLDGGSSKRMVLQGETLDLPSTEIDAGQGRGLTAVSIRPVYTALLMFPQG